MDLPNTPNKILTARWNKKALKTVVLFGAVVVVITTLVGCAPAPVTAAPPEPTAISSPTELPTATETPTPLPTDTGIAVEPPSTPTPDKTLVLTKEQQKQYQKQVILIQKWFTNAYMQTYPDLITVYPNPYIPKDNLTGQITIYPDPNKPGNALVKDSLTGRLIADGNQDWFYYKPDNLTGVDGLNGVPVFNLNLVKKIEQDIQPGNWAPYGHENTNSTDDDYCFKLIQASYLPDNGVKISAEVGGVAKGETIVYNPVFLGKNSDGKNVWGIVVGKRNKDGWVSSPRRVIYETASGTKDIEVYFPNYLFFS